MLYKIALICDEVADFFREITIDADATFLDLNNAILEACGYDDSQITSFFTCSDTWDKEQQIVREDMGTSAEDEDVYLMASTPLRDLLEDEEQKLIYIFDPANDRIFYLELTEIVTGKSMDKAECSMSRGKAPQQLKGFDLDFNTLGSDTNDLDLDLDDFSSDGYNDDEFDPDSFGIDGE
ncbi:MAG: hypothetical protein J6W50_02305 [Bacteroidaceae bacterium]|nr:hypothetical protein [Bacteroidaceae bacterium]MBP5731524.1 hypothetical protein [Bacteroidaceae bacterium]